MFSTKYSYALDFGPFFQSTVFGLSGVRGDHVLSRVTQELSCACAAVLGPCMEDFLVREAIQLYVAAMMLSAQVKSTHYQQLSKVGTRCLYNKM